MHLYHVWFFLWFLLWNLVNFSVFEFFRIGFWLKYAMKRNLLRRIR